MTKLLMAAPYLLVIALAWWCNKKTKGRPNRRVRRNAWPKRGSTAPPGYFADATQRPGPECAGKVG
jgi:hypothetical protein